MIFTLEKHWQFTGFYSGRQKHNEIAYFEIPEEGYVLQPTNYIWVLPTNPPKPMPMCPFLRENLLREDKVSSFMPQRVRRHWFLRNWTLESVSIPVRVYAGMPVGQLIFSR